MSAKAKLITYDETGAVLTEKDSVLLFPFSEGSTDGHFISVFKVDGKFFFALGGDAVQPFPDIKALFKQILDDSGFGYDYSTPEALQASIEAISEENNETLLKMVATGIIFEDEE